MKIVAFLPNWIGTPSWPPPALRALRQRFADARLIGVLKPYVAAVFAGCRGFDSYLPLDSRGPWQVRWPAVAARLRHERADLAILFPNSFRSAFIAWLAGCRHESVMPAMAAVPC